MFRYLLIPPVTALCVLVTSVFDSEESARLDSFRKWTSLWTRKVEVLDESEQFNLTQSAFFFPIGGVILLSVGVIFGLGQSGVEMSDEFLNSIIFGPALVFAYVYFLISVVEFSKNGLAKLRWMLNSIVEVALYCVLYGFFVIIDMVGRV